MDNFYFDGDGCYFARGGKVTKPPPGDGSDERLRAAGAHSHLSPGPPLRGTPACGIDYDLPAGKDKICDPPCLGPLGPTNCKFERYTVEITPPTLAKPWQLSICGKHSLDHRRTKQVGKHQAACVSVAMPSNFDGSRPLWAENRTETGLDFARRKRRKTQRDTLP